MTDFESTVLNMFGNLQSDILQNRTMVTELSVTMANQCKVLDELNVATKKNTEALSKLPPPKEPVFTSANVKNYLKIITIVIAIVTGLVGGAVKIFGSTEVPVAVASSEQVND